MESLEALNFVVIFSFLLCLFCIPFAGRLNGYVGLIAFISFLVFWGADVKREIVVRSDLDSAGCLHFWTDSKASSSSFPRKYFKCPDGKIRFY